MEARPSAGGRIRDRWTPEAFVAIGLLANIVVVLTTRFFPYQDGANHLARYVLLERAWFGIPPAGVRVRLLPTSYIGVDVLGAVLVHLVGAHAALRLIVLLAIVLIPGGMYLLLRATAPERRGWALVGVLLGLAWYLLDGLLNYVIGAGLALVWLALWWPHRAEASWPRRLALAAGAAVLFLTHLSAPLIVLVVVWIDWLLALRARNAAGARFVTALASTLVVAALWIWVEVALGRSNGVGGELDFRSAAWKLRALGAPFFSFSMMEAGVLALGWAASLAAFLWTNRRALRWDTIVVSAISFLLLFAAFPVNIGAAGGVDVRWLLPAYLLPFCATVRGRVSPQRGALTVALIACIVHAGICWSIGHRRDRTLGDFAAVLHELPRGSRLLPIVADGHPHPRVGTYQEFWYWHVIDNAGEVPGLFNYAGTREGDPHFAHFAHFEILYKPYMPPYGWGTVESSAPLDWRRIARDYDYIVQAGTDPVVTAYLQEHARERRRVGEITLYQVTAPR